MSSSIDSKGPPSGHALGRAAQIVVVSSVMFTFISFWRTAAIVLCDMSSTAYYIGAIVESAIGKAAPWFILAVLLFSYAMRAVYIESSSLFVRGGVYRVVKEAMGGVLAKVSVSALLFDYVLTGPISGVSAGQYIVGLLLETLARIFDWHLDPSTRDTLKCWGSVAIACGVTLYFLRENLLGIPESSGKALKIMIATAVMGCVMLAWSGVTLAVRGPVNDLPTWHPDLQKKVEITADGDIVPRIDPVTGDQQDPLGVLGWFPTIAEPLRNTSNWLSVVGVIGLIIAFGHSILAMSGEETLAQVYREVEAPKLQNFKKAAFVVFAFSLLLTGTLNMLTVILVPDNLRMTQYYDNWIGGLAMQMVGPDSVRLMLNAFVVVVGFLILSGAVNTSIVGSNGVLSRVAEDGVLPDWFLKPHPRFGTNYRQLYLIAGLQLFTIIASRGNVILLGEAYAFGVVWSFVFKTCSMVVLRLRDRTPREFLVPFNIRVRGYQVPIGLSLVFLIVLLSAIANLFTKPVATVGGLLFTAVFSAVFFASEAYHRRRRGEGPHEHLEQFNRTTVTSVTAEGLGLNRPYRKLVAIRSPNNLFMLDRALAETDPAITDIVVMTAKVEPRGTAPSDVLRFDGYDQQLLTAVVNHAERSGKTVLPLLVPTNNPLNAVLTMAKNLPAQELILGASNKYTVEEQLDQAAFYWINLHNEKPPGLTVHIISADRDVTFDLAGGNRIPKVAERRARTVADLRAAGIGVRRILLAHDGTSEGSDVFEWLMTMLDAEIDFGLICVASTSENLDDFESVIQKDALRACQLGRSVQLHQSVSPDGPLIVRTIAAENYDALVVPWSKSSLKFSEQDNWIRYVLERAPCNVFLAAHPAIPREAVG